MQLFIDPRSPNCIKVLVVAKHLEIELEQVKIDLSSAEQNAPDFLALNPMGQVPVLLGPQGALTESNAIIQYLAEVAEDTGLWPTDLWTRASVARWLTWSSAQLAPAVRPFQWERMFKSLRGGGNADPVVIASAEVGLAKVLTALERTLSAGNSGCGIGQPIPTLADFAVAATLIYAEPAGLPLHEFPKTATWRDRIMALPAWRGVGG